MSIAYLLPLVIYYLSIALTIKAVITQKSARTRKILEGSIESPEKAIHKKIRQFNKMIVKLLTPAIAITASSYLAIFIRKLNKPIGIAMQEKLGIINGL